MPEPRLGSSAAVLPTAKAQGARPSRTIALTEAAYSMLSGLSDASHHHRWGRARLCHRTFRALAAVVEDIAAARDAVAIVQHYVA
jgi:hypothetical protein